MIIFNDLVRSAQQFVMALVVYMIVYVYMACVLVYIAEVMLRILQKPIY